MHQFTVTDARTAIACPRIFYFDEHRYKIKTAIASSSPANSSQSKRTTMIWTGAASDVSGCGSIFHRTIEKFNRLAYRSDEVRRAIQSFADSKADSKLAPAAGNLLTKEIRTFINENCCDAAATYKKTPPEQKALFHAFDQYVEQLVEIFSDSLKKNNSAETLISHFFSDNRKRVDVTFYVGPTNQPIRIKGNLDYIYFDQEASGKRVVDFKLIPADAAGKDVMQVSLYALMHHQQHHTSPSGSVMYLHPTRRMIDHSWNEINAKRPQIYNLLASMAAWSDYDETTGKGIKPPGEPSLCSRCPWSRDNQCVKRLGPVTEGDELVHWAEQDLVAAEAARAEKHEPPESGPEVELDDDNDDDENDDHNNKNNRVQEEINTIESGRVNTNLDLKKTSSPEALGQEPTDLNPSRNQQVNGQLYLGCQNKTGKPISIPIQDLVTHLSVVGAAGSGKTWLAKVIAEEAILAGVPIIAIDPQGDLVQFLRPSTNTQDWSPELLQSQQRFLSKAEVRIWTPGSSHAARLSLSPLRLSTIDEVCEPNEQRRKEEWEAMLSIAASTLVEMVQPTGQIDLYQAFVLRLLKCLAVSNSLNSVTIDHVVEATENPKDFGFNDADRFLKKSSRTHFVQKLMALQHGPSANLFTGGTALNLDRFIEPLDAGKVPLNVIYLNALQDSQKSHIVASLVTEIYRWMISNAATGKARLLVFLDEARDYIPAGARIPPAKEPLVRLFAQARKFGVSGLICTQSPRSVDYRVFGNISTKFVGRLEAAQDVERVKEWFTDNQGPPTWLTGRIGAARGSMIGRWPSILSDQEGKEFFSRPLYSLHEGAWSPEKVREEWLKSPYAERLSGNVTS